MTNQYPFIISDNTQAISDNHMALQETYWNRVALYSKNNAEIPIGFTPIQDCTCSIAFTLKLTYWVWLRSLMRTSLVKQTPFGGSCSSNSLTLPQEIAIMEGPKINCDIVKCLFRRHRRRLTSRSLP